MLLFSRLFSWFAPVLGNQVSVAPSPAARQMNRTWLLHPEPPFLWFQSFTKARQHYLRSWELQEPWYVILHFRQGLVQDSSCLGHIWVIMVLERLKKQDKWEIIYKYRVTHIHLHSHTGVCLFVGQTSSDHQIPSDLRSLYHATTELPKILISGIFQTCQRLLSHGHIQLRQIHPQAMPTLHNLILPPHSAFMPHLSSSSPGCQLLHIILAAASAPYTNSSSISRG